MFRRSSHSVYDCRYHLIWSTKYRKRALTHDHERKEVEGVLRRIAQEYDMEIHAMEVDEDHVHIYIEIPPQKSVGQAVRELKSVSARWVFHRFPYMRKKYWGGEFWEASYFARTCGEGVTAEMVKRYIETHEARSLGSAQGELFPNAVKSKKK